MAKMTWTAHAGDDAWNNSANSSPAQGPVDFADAIGGFAGSHTIELANPTAASLHFSGSYTQSDVGVANDTHGNVVIEFT